MNKITKKTIKRIKAGYHDDLIDAIEFLIDTHNEDKFESGYKCRIQDEAVVSYRLAEHIYTKYKTKFGRSTIEDLAKVIESYYSENLKD